jgi:cytochrome c oxidase subunit 2
MAGRTGCPVGRPDIGGRLARQAAVPVVRLRACHAIGGTPAAGRVGPDLTHVGSRRSLAANTLQLTKENLARFISENQHVKPANRMPPFRIFSSAKLDALAAYLLSLR